ncbi:hypothetical protein RF11_15174 [Thelohanellus kitauei]|uniref:Integrase catalytic domain-containing protein n=1 Tax=Thelohanellus kitauei TaxID=669202 RepID=A0A0C2MZC5_THEKT|nr:hypothetical protein RF11_15174 [Thelohanellus kitauei]
MIVIDSYLKWVELYPLHSCTADETVNCLEDEFSATPCHSRTNCQAERIIRTLKEKYKKLNNISDIKKKLCTILLWYRYTLPSTFKRSPAEAILHRRLRGVINKRKSKISENITDASTRLNTVFDRNK